MLAKHFTIIINSLLMLLLFSYATMQLPVLGLMVGSLMPLPVILTIRRAGWLPGALLVTAAVGILYYVEHFTGLKADLLPLLHMAAIGFAIAFFSWRRHRLEVIVAGTVFLSVALQVGIFLLLAWQQGVNPQTYLQQTVAEIWQLFSKLIEKEPILQQEIKLTGLDVAAFTTRIVQLSPAFLVISSTLVVLVNYLLSQNLGEPPGSEDRQPPLIAWEAPGWLVFMLIGAGFLVLVPHQVLHLMGINVLLVCGLLYFLQGLAIVNFNFRRFQVPRPLRWLAYLLLVILKPAIILIILMGLVDLWLDFRRLHRPASEA